MVARLSAALQAFRAGHGHLVWTVHNVLPHEAEHGIVSSLPFLLATMLWTSSLATLSIHFLQAIVLFL